ncbi:LexA family transcriptional regulator [Marinilactibacillus psychrotolerans]|uniref:LexA family transcriptional regulator n=1 Tax=Marinilactibacillus psychrotolerans TaxID=191770 RepID=A0A5R9C412_9LACT|nr:XRE family transcriptional regulator [Marinilactibacillus psychrotolerans]TLQ07607.1 LexA family transcriptional regulator [Marinilactibacillus psychrotolerans]
MNIGERMKERRKQLKITADQVAEKIGVSRSNVYRYEKGDIEKLPIEVLEPLSEILRTTPQYLMGWETNEDILTVYNELEKPRKKKVYNYAESLLEEQNKVVELPNRKAPLLGDVAANPTELAYGDPVYDEEVTSNVPSGADGALTIQGDSMEDLFRSGDICFFHRQPDVENGEIAIVEIDGTGVTCKKVIKENGSIILRSLNDKYKDRKIEKESVRIIGKVLV